MRAVKAQPEKRRGYADEDGELQERPRRNLRPQADDKRNRTPDNQQPADQFAPPDAALFHEGLQHFGERATRLTRDFGDAYRNIVRGGGDFVEFADAFLDVLFDDEDVLLDESGRLLRDRFNRGRLWRQGLGFDESGRRLLRGRFNRDWPWRQGFGFEARRDRISANGSKQ